ncbi:hypothetical protein NQ024_10765 [Corynebacterium sp. 35RC1]|nr:hypothetical protein [Corynebacterium sp. 35RC1]
MKFHELAVCLAPAQVIHLGEGAEALYGFTRITETTDHHDPRPSEAAETM